MGLLALHGWRGRTLQINGRKQDGSREEAGRKKDGRVAPYISSENELVRREGMNRLLHQRQDEEAIVSDRINQNSQMRVIVSNAKSRTCRISSPHSALHGRDEELYG